MKKCFAAAALVLGLATGAAWSYPDWSDTPACSAEPAASPTDPLATAEAHRHFHNEPTHWTSAFLVME